MHSRDLFLGLFLLAGAAWIAAAFPTGLRHPAYVLAVGGCGLAGVVYLLAGGEVGVGETVAGRTLTRLRLRAVSQALLGVSMTAIGFGGYVADGDTFSAAVAAIGIVVIGLSRILWNRGAPGFGESGPSDHS